MTTLIGKLTKAALLSPAEASEEFRQGIVLCIKSVVQALQACKSLSCSCKYVLLSPFSILNQDPRELYEGYTYTAAEEDVIDEELTTVDYVTPEVCPLGFLQSIDMAPVIGHLLSLLLQVAHQLPSIQTQFFCFMTLVLGLPGVRWCATSFYTGEL